MDNVIFCILVLIFQLTLLLLPFVFQYSEFKDTQQETLLTVIQQHLHFDGMCNYCINLIYSLIVPQFVCNVPFLTMCNLAICLIYRRLTQGKAKCFFDFLSALQLPECLYHSI